MGHKVWVNKYDTKIVKTEDESALSKGGVTPVVINEDETNMWGSPRGYKVRPACARGRGANWEPEQGKRLRRFQGVQGETPCRQVVPQHAVKVCGCSSV